jgi:hypothetical protein
LAAISMIPSSACLIRFEILRVHELMGSFFLE